LGACLLIAGASVALAAGEARQKLIPPYSFVSFQAYQGETFRVWGGEGLGQVVKLKLERLTQGPIDPKVEQFSLYFSGPKDYVLEESSYTFKHPDSGVFRLWLELFDNGSNAQQWYWVEFNLLK
jgi:hypothetical protein